MWDSEHKILVEDLHKAISNALVEQLRRELEAPKGSSLREIFENLGFKLDDSIYPDRCIITLYDSQKNLAYSSEVCYEFILKTVPTYGILERYKTIPDEKGIKLVMDELYWRMGRSK